MYTPETLIARFIAEEVGEPKPTEGMRQQARDLLSLLRSEGYRVVPEHSPLAGITAHEDPDFVLPWNADA